MRTRAIALAALLLFSACARGADKDAHVAEVAFPAEDAALHRGDRAGPALLASPPQEEPAAAPGAGAELPLPETAVSLSPMLIRTGSATVRVDSLDRAIAGLRALAREVGGIVGNLSVSAGEQQARHATVELRVPSEHFDRAVSGLAPIGRVEGVNVSAQDVGEEYADVEARVANARRLEARLMDLLERRTGRLEEMLHVEREIARVRGEIERYEGRLRYLRTRASVSLLTVTLREPQALIGPRPGEQPIRDAFREAWDNFVGVISFAIAALGFLVPFGLLLFAAWRGWRALRRRDAERDAEYRARLRRERAERAEEDEPLGV